MQIIDAHQHFWDLDHNHLPWLKNEPPIPFRYGDYSALKRNYMPEDYRRDSAGFEVVGTVFVETEWDPRDPLGEVAWVDALRREHGLPNVMVAQAWLNRDDAEIVLAAHGRHPLVRGIRHKPRAAPSPDAVVAGAPGSMGDPAWRRGYAMLARNGLSFDLQTPWWHLHEARLLADDFPETQIVLNHTGLPADRSEEGLQGWRAAMRILAGAPNVAVKISGLGQAGRPWSLEANRSIVLDTIDMFGVERAMFASNFPVDSLVGDFAGIFSGFDAITSGFSAAEREALFRGNAQRIYRIPESALGHAA
ncbi:MAG TPA: amidohydrolase family protein [Alphaproteobacteria bacterium]|nr:amidohydrolase family protein [Alphaproteobacteria bacterium]